MIDRRTLMQCAPLALVAGTASSAAESDPHHAWVARWVELREEMNAHIWDLEDDDPRWPEVQSLEERVAQTQARTVQGLIAQMRMATHPDYGLIDGSYAPVQPQLLESIAATLRDMA